MKLPHRRQFLHLAAGAGHGDSRGAQEARAAIADEHHPRNQQRVADMATAWAKARGRVQNFEQHGHRFTKKEHA